MSYGCNEPRNNELRVLSKWSRLEKFKKHWVRLYDVIESIGRRYKELKENILTYIDFLLQNFYNIGNGFNFYTGNDLLKHINGYVIVIFTFKSVISIILYFVILILLSQTYTQFISRSLSGNISSGIVWNEKQTDHRWSICDPHVHPSHSDGIIMQPYNRVLAFSVSSWGPVP